jgi:DNA (cytosine-5)-methyltransferase 1
MPKPLLLDLFCGAGGAGEGYARAGFRVVGVDLDAKPLRHNPHETYQGDALEVLDTLLAGEPFHGYHLRDFAAIHASPICKGYSQANNIHRANYPMLIEPTRKRLRESGLPWVVENVRMTGRWRGHMPSAVVLCGTSFGLRVYRHRYFEASHLLFTPGPCSHPTKLLPGYLSIFGHGARGTQKGNRGNHYTRYGVDAARAAMGIDWMTREELSQAIPPAYTQWIGRQLLPVVMGVSA